MTAWIPNFFCFFHRRAGLQPSEPGAETAPVFFGCGSVDPGLLSNYFSEVLLIFAARKSLTSDSGETLSVREENFVSPFFRWRFVRSRFLVVAVIFRGIYDRIFSFSARSSYL